MSKNNIKHNKPMELFYDDRDAELVHENHPIPPEILALLKKDGEEYRKNKNAKQSN